jgi:phage tail-like protein
MTWTLKNAFPKQVTPTDMNSQSSEVAVESIVFVCEGLTIEAA